MTTCIHGIAPARAAAPLAAASGSAGPRPVRTIPATPATSSGEAPRVLALLLLLASTAGPLVGQQVATARVEENFRAEPNGTIIARVLPGSELAATRVRGNWVESELEGWVWANSLRATGGRGFVVSVAEGENLRAEPQGTILARVAEGARLDELGRRPGWIRVRRVGWIWLDSVRLDEAAEPEPTSAGEEDTPGSDTTSVAAPTDPSGAARAGPPPDSGRSSGATPAPTAEEAEALTVPGGGLAVLTAPNGDTLARAHPGGDVPVLSRDGAWARVRVEGWVWVGSPPAAEGDSADAPATVDVETAIREPDRYRGRLVTWPLQFVSLERAERMWTDLREGESYLLTRPPGATGTFVYVAVPQERVSELGSLTPLESIEVVGRIRTGASSLTGSPILDLVELRRRGR